MIYYQGMVVLLQTQVYITAVYQMTLTRRLKHKIYLPKIVIENHLTKAISLMIINIIQIILHSQIKMTKDFPIVMVQRYHIIMMYILSNG